MPLTQYRKGGGGEIYLYARRSWLPKWFPEFLAWYKVECSTSRKKVLANKIADHAVDLEGLVRELYLVNDNLKAMEESINNSHQENPNHSDPKEMTLPKDSKKYRKTLGKLSDSYLPLFQFISQHKSLHRGQKAVVRDDPSHGPINVERVGVGSHPVGPPVRNNGGKKNNGNNQNQKDDFGLP